MKGANETMNRNTLGLLTLAMLAVVSVVSAAPAYRIGSDAVLNLVSSGVTYYDSAGNTYAVITRDNPFVGLRLFAEYAPFQVVRIKVALAEARFLLTGGTGWLLLPELGGEVAIEPPRKGRFAPYLWFGGSIVSYTLPANNGLQFVNGQGSHLRAGLGARYAITPRVRLSSELFILSRDVYTSYDPTLGAVVTDVTEAVAVNEVRPGVAYTLK